MFGTTFIKITLRFQPLFTWFLKSLLDTFFMTLKEKQQKLDKWWVKQSMFDHYSVVLYLMYYVYCEVKLLKYSIINWDLFLRYLD
jgi:hypothetical protein